MKHPLKGGKVAASSYFLPLKYFHDQNAAMKKLHPEFSMSTCGIHNALQGCFSYANGLD